MGLELTCVELPLRSQFVTYYLLLDYLKAHVKARMGDLCFQTTLVPSRRPRLP